MKYKPAFLFCALLLAACSMTPDYNRPVVEVPQTWRDGGAAAALEISPVWWESYGSKELNSLVAAAQAGNTDIRAALARVDQSRASLKIAGATLLPEVDAGASAGWTRESPLSGSTSSRNSGRATLGVSYELDLFGRNRAAVDAARAGLRGQESDRDALALVVMSDVARGYFALVSLRERIAIAEKNIKNARDVLKIVQARFDAGMSSGIDLARQKTSVASAEAALTALRNQATVQENALSVLLGRAPADLKLRSASLARIKLPAIAPVLPADLLQRRPDINTAEQALIAANADIGAARAAFFPSVNLGTDLALAFSPLSDPASKTLALAASLAAPIFKGGALQGGVERATARQVELAENYRKTVLTALRETEDALASVRAAAAREVSLRQAMTEARKSYDLSRDLFDAGSTDFQTLLDAERTVLSAEDSYAGVRLERLNATVDLYKALGGGWRAGR